MAQPAQATFRRRTVYIEKNFQRNFILRFCVLAFVCMALASGLFYFMSGDTVTASYRSSHLVLEKTSTAVLGRLMVVNLAVLAAFVVATVFVTLYVSFKIGGPLYRFSQDMTYIGQGHLSKRIRLRQGDQLQKFATDLNGLVASLEERVRQLQTGLAELAASAENMPREELKAKIKELDDLSGTLFDKKS